MTLNCEISCCKANTIKIRGAWSDRLTCMFLVPLFPFFNWKILELICSSGWWKTLPTLTLNAWTTPQHQIGLKFSCQFNSMEFLASFSTIQFYILYYSYLVSLCCSREWKCCKNHCSELQTPADKLQNAHCENMNHGGVNVTSTCSHIII